jgi:hypothetical protein
MPVLSIVACRMLEDELAYVLSADGEVQELLLVDGKEALSLSAKLKAQNRPHLLLGRDRIAPHLQERQRRPGGIFSRRTGPKAEELAVVVSPLRLGLQRIELPGGTAVAEGCYERAKSRLAARPGRAEQHLQFQRVAPGADAGHLPHDKNKDPERLKRGKD